MLFSTAITAALLFGASYGSPIKGGNPPPKEEKPAKELPKGLANELPKGLTKELPKEIKNKDAKQGFCGGNSDILRALRENLPGSQVNVWCSSYLQSTATITSTTLSTTIVSTTTITPEAVLTTQTTATYVLPPLEASPPALNRVC